MKPILKGSNIATFKKLAKEISKALTEGKDISSIVGEENVKDFGAPFGIGVKNIVSPQLSQGNRDVQPVVNMIKESQDEGELTDKEIAETLEEYFPKEDIQAAFDLINNPTENEPTITESSEFTPDPKDVKAFEKILGTTSGAIRNKNIAEAVKDNPKIKEIMDNFEELKKQLMERVELTEDCNW